MPADSSSLSSMAWRAMRMDHATHPVQFFVFLFACAIPYSCFCYTDSARNDRTQSAVLTACFAALTLVVRLVRRGVGMVWKAWRHSLHTTCRRLKLR